LRTIAAFDGDVGTGDLASAEATVDACGAAAGRRRRFLLSTSPLRFLNLLDEARAALPDAVALRRRIHASPELGLELPETQRAVLDALAGLELELETGGKTSCVVATLRGARPGPTILLRADMDALPMPEDTGLPFSSARAGAMHACGHDAHVAMLAGAARLLARRRDGLAGSVKLLFQPGEEGHGGMRVLIEEGLLEAAPRPEAAFAIHVDSMLPAGSVATRPGPILASGDVLSIDLAGKGGHASMPHHAVDPVPVAAELVLALQSLVTRRIDAFDPIVLSITRITTGTTSNVIPASAHLLGTIRSVSEKARRAAHEGVRRVAAGVASAHGVEAKVHILEGYPVTVNDAEFAGFARGVAKELVGDGGVIDMRAPIMGAEDFSYLLERVPGAMVFLGARPPDGEPAPLHSNRMRLEESAMATGMALHAAVALRWLGAGGA
jgi:hippurate hydrolase